MSSGWQQSSTDSLSRVAAALRGSWHALSQPARALRIRQGIMALLVLWAVFALAKLVWAFLPHADADLAQDLKILNPIHSREGGKVAKPVDLKTMVSWHLFGVAGEDDASAAATLEPIAASDRDGIEKGARETRLDLKLRGVVSASEDGLGHAMIEHRSKQNVYAVGDELPVGKRVTLAKVMSHGVVLDNKGTFELLLLYEETPLLGQLPAPKPRPKAKIQPRKLPSAGTGNNDATKVAQDIRQQLYSNPQSLAEVVRVSAVRENNALTGYRVQPGKSSSQFTQLGFQSGDIVTSINGVSLDNPSNTMQLYQLMRSASEAVFEVQRDGQNLTLSVSLDENGNEG